MDADKEKAFEQLMNDPFNKVCCDCGIPSRSHSFSRPGLAPVGLRQQRRLHLL